MKVDAVVWEVSKGVITSVKIDNDIFYNNGFQRVGRTTDIERWINERDIQEFTLKDFFNDYPKAKVHRTNHEKHISILIAKKRLQQMGNEKFKVLK